MNRKERRRVQQGKLTPQEEQARGVIVEQIKTAFEILFKGCAEVAHSYNVSAVPISTIQQFMKTIIEHQGANGEDFYNKLAMYLGDKSNIQPEADPGESGGVAE